jgi:nucleoside-diphosphate-sugar epimerase
VINKVIKLRFRNFIHISTSSVNLKFQTAYSATKKWGEYLISSYAQKTEKALFSVRPYSIFGEGEDEARFIPSMVRNLAQGKAPVLDAKPSHDWVYVKDFVQALNVLAEKVYKPIPPQEVGYGMENTNLQVFRDIKKIMGLTQKVKHIPVFNLRPYDQRHAWYKRKTDYLDTIWDYSIGYWEGLKNTVSYYQNIYAKRLGETDSSKNKL